MSQTSWKVGDTIYLRNTGSVRILNIKEGGWGIVYIAINPTTNETRAIKMIQERFLKNELVVRRFIQEAHLWINLDAHDNIVTADFIDTLHGRPCLLMEYIEGGSLRYQLKPIEPLPLEKAIKFAFQLANGMSFVWKTNKIVHRDLKPDNIMITPDKTVKITDFGLAKAFSEIDFKKDTIPGDVRTSLSIFRSKGKRLCGTLPWMAPEQFNGFADQRSDIYSFGVVMHQMVAKGKHLFKGTNIQEYENFHRYEVVPPLSHPLFPLIQKCLEKDPNKRFQNYASLREKLQDLLITETGKIIEPPDVEKLNEPELYNKALALANLDRYDEAISCYDKVLEIDPKDVEVLSNKGRAFFKLSRDDAAISCYDKALNKNLRLAIAWYNKGSILGKFGKYEEAILCFDKALEINSNFGFALRNKGIALFRPGRNEEAISFFDKSLVINPNNVLILFGKASILTHLGRYSEALKYAEKVIEINPNFPQAHQLKNFILQNLER